MSKSRGERSGKTPSGSQAASNNTQNAVVPGKFMETDWYVDQFLEVCLFSWAVSIVNTGRLNFDEL